MTTRWRHVPFRRTEIFTWCWEVESSTNIWQRGWQGTHSDTCSVIITLAVIMKALLSTEQDIASWSGSVQEGASKVLKVSSIVEPWPAGQTEWISVLLSELFSQEFWSCLMFESRNVAIQLTMVHHSFCQCLCDALCHSNTAICKHTLQIFTDLYPLDIDLFLRF